MNSSQLLNKLTEIERAIGVVDTLSLRRMIVEAQDYILQSQKETLQELRQNTRRAVVGD
jgi:PHD/YefM family antitoxin component YafN of YafNO toxin-antitoxin module